MIINEILIEKYFSKRLSETELLDFEKKYETDQDFKDEVDFLKDIQYISEIEDDAHFKSRLTAYESESPKTEQSVSPKWLKPLVAVAAMALIALSVTFFLKKNLNTEKLFSNHFEPSKNVSAPIVRSEDDDNLINNAFIAYSEMDYKQAAPLFEQGFKSTNNSELLFYEGNALLALDQTNEAVLTFGKHLTFSDALKNRSHWYLALAYIKLKRLDKAKQELKTFINSGETFKQKEAKSLLKKLD